MGGWGGPGKAGQPSSRFPRRWPRTNATSSRWMRRSTFFKGTPGTNAGTLVEESTALNGKGFG